MIKWSIIILISLGSTCFAEEFYKTRQWLNLLYYEKNGDQYLSVADDDRFFVSKLGKTDPKIEYETSLKLAEQQDPIFRKTFPLRYKIITQINNLPYNSLVTPSQEVNSCVIAFPNRYMSNPSSIFGHLFLILKSKQGLMDSNILHYIADISDTNQYAYIFNGLFGKFKGWFLQEPYYKKIKDYNYVEDREIIYYDLHLTTDQIQNLQLHAIELKQTYFNYYFLDENCAFFIGKLLNVVLDEDIVSKTTLIFPSQIINTLYEKSLLKNEYRRKPNTKLFNESFNSLNNNQRSEVIDLILHKTNKVPSNPAVLKTFIYISEFLINNQSNLAQIIRHNRIQAYTALKKQRQSNVRAINAKQKKVSTIKTKKALLEYGSHNQYIFSYNPIYYDINEPFGELEVKKLNCLAPRLILHPNRTAQFDITLAEISNITPYNMVTSSYSWKLNSFLGYHKSLISNQSFELGRAYHLFYKSMAFGFLGVNFANYDQLTEQKLEFLILRPSLKLGVEQQILADHLNLELAYDYRFSNNYLTAKITFIALKLHHQFTYLKSKNFDGLRFSSTVFFR